MRLPTTSLLLTTALTADAGGPPPVDDGSVDAKAALEARQK